MLLKTDNESLYINETQLNLHKGSMHCMVIWINFNICFFNTSATVLCQHIISNVSSVGKCDLFYRSS